MNQFFINWLAIMLFFGGFVLFVVLLIGAPYLGGEWFGTTGYLIGGFVSFLTFTLGSALVYTLAS